MNTEMARKYVSEWSPLMYEKGVIKEDIGSISVRIDKVMVITPDGCSFKKCKPEDLAVVRIDSGEGIGQVKPAADYRLHIALYRKKKCNAAIHTNLPNITTAARAGNTVYPMLDDMAQIVGTSAKVADYSYYPSDTQIKNILKALHWRSGVLLSGQGALCCGSDIDDAYAVCQVLEKGCKSFIETAFLGGGHTINKIETALMRFVYVMKYSKASSTNR